LYTDRRLCGRLSGLQQSQSDACQRLIQQTNKIICIGDFLRAAAI